MVEQVDVAVLERLQHEGSVVDVGAGLLDDGLIRFVFNGVLFRVYFLFIAPFEWRFRRSRGGSLIIPMIESVGSKMIHEEDGQKENEH